RVVAGCTDATEDVRAGVGGGRVGGEREALPRSTAASSRGAENGDTEGGEDSPERSHPSAIVSDRDGTGRTRATGRRAPRFHPGIAPISAWKIRARRP